VSKQLLVNDNAVVSWYPSGMLSPVPDRLTVPDGVDAWIDQFTPSPAEGWARWTEQQFTQARKAQEQMATLHHTLKKAGFASLKDAMRTMGRDVGVPRPPVDPLGEVEAGVLAKQLRELSFLEREPRGW